MRVRLVLAALALMSFSFLASPVAASGVILGVGCSDLGASAMADDHTAILLCASCFKSCYKLRKRRLRMEADVRWRGKLLYGLLFSSGSARRKSLSGNRVYQ